MSGIRTNAAAIMLGVSPNTLRSWERRYDFPTPQRSPGGHRQYALLEIESLKQALAETENVSSAVSLARERGEAPSSPRRLAAALRGFDEELSNRLLEESLAVRSVERTVEEVLLAAVATLAQDPHSPEFELAWRYAAGWLSAMKRLAPTAHRDEGVLIFDSSAPRELDGLHAQALELVLRRAGLRTLLLSTATDTVRLGRALRALLPAGIVLTGRGASLDQVGRLVYATRRVVQGVAVFDFRDALPDTGASTVGRLGDQPLAARDMLLQTLLTGVPARSGQRTPAPGSGAGTAVSA